MKHNLKGYGQMYRSGITMKEKWATVRRIQKENKEAEVTRIKASQRVPMMGKNQ